MLLSLLILFPAAVHAQDFTYTVNNGSITITGYTGPGGAVVIPDTIEGLPVTFIRGGAFSEKTSLTSVAIPNSVSSIGDFAFSDCTSLTSVTLGNSVATIGNAVFNYCSSLTNISVDTSNPHYSSLGGVIFNKSQTTLIQYPTGRAGSYVIPNGVSSIASYAFRNCLNLTGVTIPNSVSMIEDSVFVGCNKLTIIAVDAANPMYSSEEGVLFNKTQTALIRFPGGKAGGYVIPDSVNTIEDDAFLICAKVTSVTIPDNLASVGGSPFNGCYSLTNITVAAANAIYSSEEGVLFNKSQTALIRCPEARTGSYAIPDGVNTIGDSAFWYCNRLTSVTIPDSVTHIGIDAFFSCTGLTSAVIGSGVIFIGERAFRYCTGLKSVTIPRSVTSIEDDAFGSCTGLTSVYFAGNVPSHIGLFVFAGAYNATVYFLPDTTGWGTTFGGRPAVLWNPEPQITGPSDPFGFTITGANNLVIVVEAATSLANPDWTPVSTNTLTGGSSLFSDPQWVNHPGRYYRLRSP